MLSKKGFPQAISNTFSPVQTYLVNNLALLKKVKRLDLWIFGISVLVAFIVFVPKLQVSEKITDPDKAFQIENEARKTILQGLGGGFFFISVYFTWRNLQVSEKTRQAAEDKQVTERFVKAAEMLADKERLEVRVAGIYALERIAKDSPDDHWTVMEVLTLFIKERPQQPNPTPCPKDIQVALTVIGRRDGRKDGNRFIDLVNANLSKASLFHTSLSEVYLCNTNLSEAILSSANLSHAILDWATLIGADLSNANLSNATLSYAELCNVDFSRANLSGADLRMADLRGAKNLTLEQVREAKNWEEAIYDLDFAERLGLDKEEQIQRAKVWDEQHQGDPTTR